MSVIDIAELDQATIALLRRVRDRNETVEIADGGEVVARIVPRSPFGARQMTVDQLAGLLAGSPADGPPESETTREARRAHTQAVLARGKQLGREIGATWPKGVSAVEAIRDVRREL